MEMTENRLSPRVKHWTLYLGNFQSRPPDRLVMNWITETMYYKDALQVLLEQIPSSRRVLQQMCLQGKLSFQVFFSLQDIGETDLAFRVALSKYMWTYLVPLYPDVRVSLRSRLLALSTAVRHSNWKVVQTLGLTAMRTQNDQSEATVRSKPFTTVYLKAFRELIRHGQHSLALEMLLLKNGLDVVSLPMLDLNGFSLSGLDLNGVSFPRLDLNMAVETCLSCPSRACELAVEFLVHADCAPSVEVWTRLVTACIEDRKLRLLLELSNKRRLTSARFCQVLFQLAFKARRCGFVRRFCRRSQRRGILAMKVAVDLKKWNAVAQLGRMHAFDHETFYACLRKMLAPKTNDKTRHTLAVCIEDGIDEFIVICEPKLDEIMQEIEECDSVETSDSSSMNSSEGALMEIVPNDLTRTSVHFSPTEWCQKHGYHQLAILSSLAQGKPHVGSQVIKQQGSFLGPGFLMFVVAEFYRQCDIDAFVTILLTIRGDDDDNFYGLWLLDLEYDILVDDDDRSDALLKACRQTSLRAWCLSMTSNWDLIERELKCLPDQELADKLVVRAADEEAWDFVLKFLPQCSQTQSLLFEILKRAIHDAFDDDALKVADTIMKSAIIDPCLFSAHGGSLLNLAASSIGIASNRKQLVRICIKSGVSTYELSSRDCRGFCRDKENDDDEMVKFHKFICDSTDDDDDEEDEENEENSLTRPSGALKEAYSRGHLPVVRLLYQSGATSYKELHSLKCDDNLRSNLMQANRNDLVSFLDDKASTPRPLESTCRLRVSHLIGCRPGRESRVASLPLPEMVKDLILFKDICDSTDDDDDDDDDVDL